MTDFQKLVDILGIFTSCLFCWALAGCTVTTVGVGGGRVDHHFGYVRISQPSTDNGLSASRVTTLGLNLNPGLTIGLQEDELILNPINESTGEPTCNFTLIIRDQADEEFVRRLLESIKGENICSVQF